MALVKEAHKHPIATKMSLEIEDSNSLRQIRNRAEKQRRDRLNGYLAELATIVPMVKNATKPLDKVSILRLAAAHLRLNKSCLNSKLFQSNIPTLPSTIHLEEIEKYIGGFLIAVTFSGVVVFCSKCIEDFLGYQNIDLMGHYVCNFVHKKQAPYLEKKIRFIASQYKKGDSDKISKVIQLHLLQRPLPRSNEVKYQKMKLKLSVHNNETLVQQSPCNPEIVHSSPEDTVSQKSKDFGTSAVILIFVEPLKYTLQINVDKPLEIKDTYFTIHGLKTEIIYSDQRISTITGYLPSDVIGSSAYQFIYEPDIPIALFAQKAMFTSEDGIGLIVYRLKIFGSKYIYLQSKGQLVYKEKSTEISHFICCNQWLSEKEGDKRLKRFHNRFAPQIAQQKKRDACNTEKTVFTEVTYQPGIKESVNESYSNVDLRLDSVVAMDKTCHDTSTTLDSVQNVMNFVNTLPQNTGKVLTESVVDSNIMSRISAPEYFNQSTSSNEVYGVNCNSYTIETSQYISKPSYESCPFNNTLTGGNAIPASGEVQFVDIPSSEINRLIESNYLSNMQNQNVNCEVKNNVLLYPGKGQPEFASLQFQKQELPNSNSANWNFQVEGNRQTPRSCEQEEHSREILECPCDSNFEFTVSESQPPQFAQNILISDWMKTQSIDLNNPPYLNNIQCNDLDNAFTSTYVQNSVTSYSDANECPSPVMVSNSGDSMDASTLDNISFVACDSNSMHRNLKRNSGFGKLEVQGTFKQNNFSTSIPIKKLRTSDFVITNPNGLDTVGSMLVPFQENGNSSGNQFNVGSSLCNDIFDSDTSKQVFNELNTFFNTLPLTPSMQSSHVGLGEKF